MASTVIPQNSLLQLEKGATPLTDTSINSLQTQQNFAQALNRTQPVLLAHSSLSESNIDTSISERSLNPRRHYVAQNTPASGEGDYRSEKKVLADMLSADTLRKLQSQGLDQKLAVLMAKGDRSIAEIANLFYTGNSAEIRFTKDLVDAAGYFDKKLGTAAKKNPDLVRYVVDLLHQTHSQVEPESQKLLLANIVKEVLKETRPYELNWDIYRLSYTRKPGDKLVFDVQGNLSMDSFIGDDVYMSLSVEKARAFTSILLGEYKLTDHKEMNFRDPVERQRYGETLLTVLSNEKETPPNFYRSEGLTLSEAINEMTKLYIRGMSQITDKQRAIFRVLGRSVTDSRAPGTLVTDQQAEHIGEIFTVDTFSRTVPDWVKHSRYFEPVVSLGPEEYLIQTIQQELASPDVVSIADLQQNIAGTAEELPNIISVVDDAISAQRTGNALLEDGDLAEARTQLESAQNLFQQATNALTQAQATLDQSVQRLSENEYLVPQRLNNKIQQSTTTLNTKLAEAETGITELESALTQQEAQSGVTNAVGQIATYVNNANESMAESSASLARAQNALSQNDLDLALEHLDVAEQTLQTATEHVGRVETQAVKITRLAERHTELGDDADRAGALSREVKQQLQTGKVDFQQTQQQIEVAMDQVVSQDRQATQRQEQEEAAAMTLSLAVNMPATVAQYDDLPADIRHLLVDMWLSPNTDLQALLAPYPNITEDQLQELAEAQNVGINDGEGLQRYIGGWGAIEQTSIHQLINQYHPSRWTVAKAEEVLVGILANPATRESEAGRLFKSIADGSTETLGVWRLVSALEENYPGLANGFRLSEEQQQSLPAQVSEHSVKMSSVAGQQLIWLLNNYSVPQLEDMGVPKAELQTAVNQLAISKLDSPEKLHGHLQRHQNNTTPAPPPGYFRVGPMGDFPSINSRSLIRALEVAGFEIQVSSQGKVRGKGDHVRMEHFDNNGDRISVGFQGGKGEIRPGTMQRILSDAQITPAQFITLLANKVPDDLWSESVTGAEHTDMPGLTPQGMETRSVESITAHQNNPGGAPSDFPGISFSSISGNFLDPNFNPNGLIDESNGTQVGQNGNGGRGNVLTAVAAPGEDNPFSNTVPDQVPLEWAGNLNNLFIPDSVPGWMNLPIDPDRPEVLAGQNSESEDGPSISYTPSPENERGGVTVGGQLGNDKGKTAQELGLNPQGVLKGPAKAKMPESPGGFGEGVNTQDLDQTNTRDWGDGVQAPDLSQRSVPEGFPEKDPELNNILNPKGKGRPQFTFPPASDKDRLPEIPAEAQAALSKALPELQGIRYGQFSQLSAADQQQVIPRTLAYQQLAPNDKTNISLIEFLDSRQTSPTQRQQLSQLNAAQTVQQAQLNTTEARTGLDSSAVNLINARINALQANTAQINQQTQSIQQSNSERLSTLATQAKTDPMGVAFIKPESTPQSAPENGPEVKAPISQNAPIPRFMVIKTANGPQLMENLANGQNQLHAYPLPANTPITRQESNGAWSGVPDVGQIGSRLFLDLLFTNSALKMLNNGNPVQAPNSGTPQQPPVNGTPQAPTGIPQPGF